MEYLYRNISIYADSKDNLFIVPTGRSEKGGSMELDLITQLNLPYTDEEIEKSIIIAFDQCFSIKPNDNSKETAIERFLNIKGYSKAVKDKRLIVFFWSIDEGYKITPTEKIPRQGYTHIKNKVIKLGKSPEAGDLAKAVREAMNLSKG